MHRHVAATLLVAGLLVSAPPSRAAVTFVVRAPSSTPADAVLWIAGDLPELGAWNGAGLRLVRAADGAWAGTIALPAGTAFEFKVTRGSWDTVEKDAAGGEMGNRSGVAGAGADTVRVTVATWRDQAGTPGVRTHTITGEVRYHRAFEGWHVEPRDVVVWLPPGYDAQPERRYPVVYFLDGQNVFDGATSFIPGQEWRADEAADRLIRSRALEPFLMVAVANTKDRMSEYTADVDAKHGGGGSYAYFESLTQDLMRFVNENYRTLGDPAHTAIVGSSLGGLAALDLGFLYPDRFGLVGCVSPAVWWADSAIVGRVRRMPKPDLRIWLDIGTAEGTPTADGHAEWLDGARALRDALVARGWREGGDLHYEEVPGAKHDEAAWAARVDRLLEFLLAKP